MIHGGIDHENISCSHRHAILKEDIVSNSNVPTNGVVCLQLTQIISPTFYCVRLLEHYRDNKWTVINRSDEYAGFKAKLEAYYENEKDLRTHYPVVAGDLCIYMCDGKPYRAEIIRVFTR